MKRARIGYLMAAVLVLGLAMTAQAGLLFVPNTYGLSARSVGLGNAMTAVGGDYSVAYYNPAALGDLKTNQLDLSYMYAAPNFKGGLKGAVDEVEFDTANKLVLIGFTMNLSKFLKNEHGIGLGFDMALDDNTKSFMAFEESRDANGQFLRYGKSSVFMSVGLGIEIIPQLHIGGGAFIMIKGTNKLVANTDLAGNTSSEEIKVDAEPSMGFMGSIYAPVHDMVTIGASYRGEGLSSFEEIDASTRALVSESELTTLSLLMAFKDTYVPQQVTLGVSVRPIPELLISVEGTWANWADYEEEVMEDDTVREFADFTTKDLWIPRLGIEWTAYENLFLRFGYYFEDTPFDKVGIDDTVVLDNAKHVGSFGVGYDITQIKYLNYPLSIGATYFHQYLMPRTAKTADGLKYESSGNLNGAIATVTLRF